MRTLRLSLAGTVILALLGGLGGVVQSEESETTAFPTGTFEADAGGESVEFNADGTCRWFSSEREVPCTYVVNGDLYTEMTADRSWDGPKVPVTYHWDYDGERLVFESSSQDLDESRQDAYLNHAYRPVGETLPLPATETGYPTGSFASVGRPHHVLEFNEDGTGRDYLIPGNLLAWDVAFIYGVNGDLYAVMKTPGTSTKGPIVPATYYWDYDGEHLAFELWGEDLGPHRAETYAETYRLIEDPRIVVVAAIDFAAGREVRFHGTKLGLAAAAEVGPNVLTDRDDVAGMMAAEPISKGQPITPELLEPLPAE